MKGEVKLSDMGQALTYTQTTGKTGQKLGSTVLYMAPEFCKLDHFDTSIDIWSLGIVLVEFANKAHPY